MFFIPLGIVLDERHDTLVFCEDGLSWGKFFLNNLLPVTFGNLMGAVFMVAVMYSLAYGRSGAVVAKVWNQLVHKMN